ncbi:alginate lyase family protein [Thalassococcus sp. S3]|uniref:alginate lyase family protein n=1 Tax=Thalassococcus sp. S3 TaxID=2017482 RepID=UPI001024594B|nr:alginate lyase family protein [Thalassococcus sp. S3]QBF30871.1 hypothetical protein CFI11_06530 [Thalassococcus sp. S3]
MRLAAAVLGLALGQAALPAHADTPECAPGHQPVFSLDYGSRYKADSETRSDLDEQANAEVDEALGPVDDFIRDLAHSARGLYDAEGDPQQTADCLLDHMAVWAEAGALRDLRSHTSNLTIGSRLAGFGLILDQALPMARDAKKAEAIKSWLYDLARRQMVFWEEDAHDGSRQGNLRAWAALAVNVAGDLNEDPIMQGWSAWSMRYILCKASPDGSLPQEMTRGAFAYHYQLHAIAPLVVTSARLARQGQPMMSECDHALARIVRFAIDDMQTGAATAAIAGEVQNYFDGSRELKPFNFAWLEAYLTLDADPAIAQLANDMRPLRNSKLGGDQTLMWGDRIDG